MNICADCQNPINSCSWEREFKPVEGWVAVQTEILMFSGSGRNPRRSDVSYDVISCPLYRPPAANRKNPDQTRKKIKRAIVIEDMVTGETRTADSISAACSGGAFEKPSVYNCLTGTQHSHGGCRFWWEDEYLPPKEKRR